MPEIWEEELFGRVESQRYPWMTEKMTTSCRQTIQQADFTINLTSGASCHVARSNIRHGDEDILGLFASARIRVEKRFLQDNTTWCAVDGPRKAATTAACACLKVR